MTLNPLQTPTEKYRRSFTVSQGITFTIVTYPSKDFMNSYLTKSPRDRTIVVVVFVFVAIIIFLSYDYVASSQSKMLHGMAKIAGKLVDDVSLRTSPYRSFAFCLVP